MSYSNGRAFLHLSLTRALLLLAATPRQAAPTPAQVIRLQDRPEPMPVAHLDNPDRHREPWRRKNRRGR